MYYKYFTPESPNSNDLDMQNHDSSKPQDMGFSVKSNISNEHYLKMEAVLENFISSVDVGNVHL